MWGLPEVHFKSEDGVIDGKFTIEVKGASVDVKCVLDRFERDQLVHVHKIAYDLARASLNLISFATGLGLAVVFDQFVDADGATTAFIIHHPLLAQLCTAYSLADSKNVFRVDEIMKIVFAEPALFLALDDLITATSLHHLVVINAARAIEGLRHAMAQPGMSRGQAWELFRLNLNIAEGYLHLITDTSQSGRHGEGKYIPGSMTVEITNRSWTIMNRFLEFRKRGNQRLSLADFPLLTG